MRAAIFGLTFLAFAAVIGCATISGEQNGDEKITADTPYENEAGTPVLVELFTSEGCSSCPPADRVLATIARDQGVGDAKVITLAFHVDYWDYLGWKDRFSSAAYSARQQEYARQFRLDSSYTPQMVVDGTIQFVGSNRMQAIDAIAKNAKQPKPGIDLKLNDGELAVNIANLSTHGSSTVYLAIAENWLSTRVKAGENSGKTLEHVSAVRELIKLGDISKSETSFNDQRKLPTNSEWKSENLQYVVFVQDKDSLKIHAVNQIGR